MTRKPKKKTAPQPRTDLYRFVLCFTGECCDKPHLWGQTIHATSMAEARQKAIKAVEKVGLTVYEIIHVTHGLGMVQTLDDIAAEGEHDAADDDANREMGLPEGEDWGAK